MNRADLVSHIASKANLTKQQADQALKATIDTIMDTVKTGDNVSLIGFGTFTSSKSKAREGRNPRTGETLHIAASTSPKFKAGKPFKDMLNAA